MILRFALSHYIFADFFEARNAAEAGDHVVRSPAGRFVDYDGTVHEGNLRGYRYVHRLALHSQAANST